MQSRYVNTEGAIYIYMYVTTTSRLAHIHKCSFVCVSKHDVAYLQYKPEVEATELALAFPLPADLGSMVDVVVPSSKVGRVC